MRYLSLLPFLVTSAISSASIVSVTSGDTLLGNRGTNLLTNGSFEADQGNYANGSYWATGTALNPTMTLTGWQASGLANSYAIWGNNGSSIVNSGVIPHGTNALYFGANIMSPLNVMPTFAANGVVTWSQAPIINPKPGFGPVTLAQTISGLNTSQTYLLDFWASGENAAFGPWSDGFFGLDITGESQIFLAAPGGMSGLGDSQRYYVAFQPTASTVTIQFTNWGHYVEITGGFSSELCLDDVILNPVPEPCIMFALGGGLLSLIRRRRASAPGAN